MLSKILAEVLRCEHITMTIVQIMHLSKEAKQDVTHPVVHVF
jgi:hypothetical protein